MSLLSAPDGGLLGGYAHPVCACPPPDEAFCIFVFKICSPHQSGKSFLSGVQSAPAAIGKNVPNVIFHLKVHVYFVDLFAII